MNLSNYIGQKANDTKEVLENMGYNVIVRNITNKVNDKSISLVVRVKLLEKNVIELICSDFTFLS